MKFDQNDLPLFKPGMFKGDLISVNMFALPYWIYPVAISKNMLSITELVNHINVFGELKLVDNGYNIHFPLKESHFPLIKTLDNGLHDPYTGCKHLYGESYNDYVNTHNDLIVMKAVKKFDLTKYPDYEGPSTEIINFGYRIAYIRTSYDKNNPETSVIYADIVGDITII